MYLFINWTIILLLGGFFLGMGIFLITLPKRDMNNGALYLSMTGLTTAWWALMNAVELIVKSYQLKTIFAGLVYLSSSTLPLLIFFLGASQTRTYTNSSPGTLIRNFFYLLIIPALTCLFVAMDAQWGLVRKEMLIHESGGLFFLKKIYGPWFWIQMVYGYLLLIVGFFLIMHSQIKARAGVLKISLLILAIFFPWAGNAVYTSGWPFYTPVDLTSLGFVFSSFFFTLLFTRFEYVNIIPEATKLFLQANPEPVLILDREGKLLYFNDSCRQFLNLKRSDLKQILELDGIEETGFSIRDNQEFEREVKGEKRTYQIKHKNVLRRKKFRSRIITFNDVTSLRHQAEILKNEVETRTNELQEELEHRKRTEKKLLHLSIHDPLTGLVNRSYLMKQLQQALERFKRNPDQYFALLYLDFDDFKQLNDRFGHSTGDDFLIQISRRLSGILRNHDTVSRFGGDEFVIILEQLGSPEEAHEILSRLNRTLCTNMLLGDKKYTPSVSIGVVTSDREYNCGDEMILDADIAMYKAKEEGKGRYIIFQPSMRQALHDRLSLVNDLKEAGEKGEIYLLYQPIIELSTMEMVGVEVLARWNHPGKGNISPDLFIQLAEESGIIVELGALILKEACMAINRLKESMDLNEDFRLAVNVSGKQLTAPGFVETVESILNDENYPSENLYLEITENVFIDEQDEPLAVMELLKKLGIRFKLDDFGTGYSSLSYLHRFPFDVLKIDRAFIRDCHTDTQSREIARTVIALGHTLGMSIVAEGIEEESHKDFLISENCEEGQGYLFSKPVEIECIRDLLEKKVMV